MISTIDQTLLDLSYCFNVCGMNDEHAEQYLETCDSYGVSAEYFDAEFLVTGEPEVHDPEHLSIESFNAIHGIYFEYE